jgi:Mg2+ and Co2+ transporter CorA
MELNGEVEFPEGKIVVIYGANIQGKTNVINAIRYAFLRDVRGDRKLYDDKALPTRAEVIPSTAEKACLQVVFEHEGTPYKLVRVVRSVGRGASDILSLFQRKGVPGSGWSSGGWVPWEGEPKDFLKRHLSTGLIDILFAPESAGGFKQLRDDTIEVALGELFKEVSTAKRLANDYRDRCKRVLTEAEAAQVQIRDRYQEFIAELERTAPEIAKLAEFTQLREHAPGLTQERLDALGEKLKNYVRQFEDARLPKFLTDLAEKAKEQRKLDGIVEDPIALQKHLRRIEERTLDQRRLGRVLRQFRSITLTDGSIPQSISFNDSFVTESVTRAIADMTEARHLGRQAHAKADQLDVQLESVGETIQAKARVKAVLEGRTKRLRQRDRAWITRIDREAYAAIEATLLIKEPAYAKLKSQPIPLGTREDKTTYLKKLRQELSDLKHLRAAYARANNRFISAGSKVDKLHQDRDAIRQKLDQEIDSFRDSIKKIEQSLAVFLGRRVKTPVLKRQRDLPKFVDFLSGTTARKGRQYLQQANRELKDVGLRIEKFSRHEIQSVAKKVRAAESALPGYRKALAKIDAGKETWAENDQAYRDYTAMMRVVGEVAGVLERVTEEAADEGVLRKEVADTFQGIQEELKTLGLIEATAQFGETLMARVTYKGKEITHPAGSEKAFFSLAILTALARYFQMPILIDEVANNLDRRNLEVFFDWARRLQEQMNAQYVLSVKETRDFDLEGWVKEMGDSLCIYRLDGKKIAQYPLA